jgi:hypothetical protein
LYIFLKLQANEIDQSVKHTKLEMIPKPLDTEYKTIEETLKVMEMDMIENNQLRKKT